MRREIFMSYLKTKLKTLLILLVWSGIFGFVFFLCDVPPEVSGYGAVLCGAFLFVFAIVDFWRFYERHIQLFKKRSNINYGIEDIPVAKNIIEEDYQELIKILHMEKQKIINKEELAATSLKDYYTQWTHQIKVPISAVRLVLDTKGEIDKAMISNEIFKIEQYVDMALYYTRLDDISSDYLIKKYSLDKIVKQAIKNYSRLFIRKKISLSYDKTDIEITTDKKWFIFIIEQILSNAIKYTNSGGMVKIYSVNEGKKISLIIEDNGLGISPEDIPRIFERGYTGFNGRMEKNSTGLGLYLCRRAGKNLGIKINADSEIGKGTKIMLVFMP